MIKRFLNDFRSSVKPHFDFLVTERHYRLVYNEVSNAFDNGLVIYESALLHISVVRDRGEVWFKVRPQHQPHEFDAQILRHLLESEYRFSSSRPMPFHSAPGQAAFLRESLTDIEHLFAPALSHETIRRGEHLKAERKAMVPEAGTPAMTKSAPNRRRPSRSACASYCFFASSASACARCAWNAGATSCTNFLSRRSGSPAGTAWSPR